MAEKPVIVKLKLKDNVFEAMCHRNTIKEYREGKIKDLRAVLITENVYKNTSRGDQWKKADLTTHFESSDMDAILTRIVKNGHYQATMDENKEATSQKHREVVHYFHTHFVDPKTNLPHPQTRIESAMDMLKGLSLDPKRSAQDQATELVRKITDTGLALKKREVEGKVVVPQTQNASAQPILKKYCTTRGSPSRSDDGFLTYLVAISPADLDAFLRELGTATKGEGNFEFAEPMVVASKAATGDGKSAAGGGKGGGKGKGKKGGAA